MRDALIVSALSLLPRKASARGMGWFARSGLSRLLVRAFVQAYKVDLAEAEGELVDYPTLEALFSRSLSPGARPIDPQPGAMVSPVDAKVAFVGLSQGGQFEIAPQRRCSLGRLLGRELQGERELVVLYLAPPDYHRVHVPREGQALRWRYLPGTLWPVFPAAVRRVRGLFEGNERVVVSIDTSAGPLEVVLVGAFGVGRISLTLCDLLTNSGGVASQGELDQALVRGALLGQFHLGSTVILVAPAGSWRWQVAKGQAVRVGELLATVAP